MISETALCPSCDACAGKFCGKAQAMGWLTAFSGAAAGRPGTAIPQTDIRTKAAESRGEE